MVVVVVVVVVVFVLRDNSSFVTSRSCYSASVRGWMSGLRYYYKRACVITISEPTGRALRSSEIKWCAYGSREHRNRVRSSVGDGVQPVPRQRTVNVTSWLQNRTGCSTLQTQLHIWWQADGKTERDADRSLAQDSFTVNVWRPSDPCSWNQIYVLLGALLHVRTVFEIAVCLCEVHYEPWKYQSISTANENKARIGLLCVHLQTFID